MRRVLLALLLAPVLLATPPVRAVPTDGTCTGAERRKALRAEQDRVVERVGELSVLENEADLARLALPDRKTGSAYNVYPHLFASAAGMGLAIVNGGEVRPENPDILFYRPSTSATDVAEPFHPDFPYTLAGWGYLRDYQRGAPPSGSDDPDLCLTAPDWFVHERSVHPAEDWTNVPVPPKEDFHGEVDANQPPLPHECKQPPCVGAAHGRFWDVHLWLDDSGSGRPTISMLSPGEPIDGWDPEIGEGFFFPEEPSVEAHR